VPFSIAFTGDNVGAWHAFNVPSTYPHNSIADVLSLVSRLA
jgi:hypothetical protein